MRSAPTADAASPTGFLPVGLEGFNGTTWDRIRAGLAADAGAATGLLSIQSLLFNGSTYDRLHSASGDALAITGIPAVGNQGWNGTAFDRLRTASGTNNTQTTVLGALQVTPLSTWSVVNTTAGATAATAMNLTFAVAPAATASETVTLTGYSTP